VTVANITATAGIIRAAIVPVFRLVEAVFDGAAENSRGPGRRVREISTTAISPRPRILSSMLVC